MAQALISLEDTPDGKVEIVWDFTDGGGVDPDCQENNTLAQKMGVYVLEFIAELMDKKPAELYALASQRKPAINKRKFTRPKRR